MTPPWPLGHESIEDGYEPETDLVLKPDAPIDCVGSNKLMQLVVESDGYKKYPHLVKGRVAVVDILLYADRTPPYTFND